MPPDHGKRFIGQDFGPYARGGAARNVGVCPAIRTGRRALDAFGPGCRRGGSSACSGTAIGR